MSNLRDHAALVGVLSPQNVSTTPIFSTTVDRLERFRGWAAIVAIGDASANTLDFRIEASPVENFASGTVTVAAADQLAAHATNNDGRQLIFEVSAGRLNVLAPGCRFLRLRAVANGGSTPVAAVLFGVGARVMPAHPMLTVAQQIDA